MILGIITWVHNTRQTEIATEKLKIDLFERRYAVYVAARELLAYLCGTDQTAIDMRRTEKWLRTIREAPSFFGEEASSFFEHVFGMAANMAGKLEALGSDEFDQNRMRELIRQLQLTVSTELLKMPEKFRRELGFKQFE